MLHRNKDNNLPYFTISILFYKYKREELEIRHVPSCYDKNQLPSLTSTQLVFFDEVHFKQLCGQTTISWVNECNVLFPVNEKGGVDVKRIVYETNKSTEDSNL